MSYERVTQSLRMLGRHKRFAATAIICLGLAIALNTTMYSVLDALIHPRIDIREPHRLYYVNYYGDYRNIVPAHEKQSAIREGVAFHQGATGSRTSERDQIIERNGDIRRVKVVSIAPNYFQLLGVVPSAGRLIAENDVDDESRPVVLSERLWKQIFPDAREFRPASVLVGGTGRRIVGLLPYSADIPGRYTDVWQLPLRNEMDAISYSLVRLKPDVAIERAHAEMDVISRRFRERTHEGMESGWRIDPAMPPPFKRWNFHLAMIGSVAAVLLIACANLANLQLARGVSRARELATRAAVGASRSDIIKQLVLETSWLALGGLALGGILTAWGIQLIEHFVPQSVSDYVTYPQVSWRVLLFAAGSTLFCLVLVGLFPAIKLSRIDINELLKSGAGTGATTNARRQYGLLVVTEVALALTLLCASALITKTAIQVLLQDIGYDYEGIVYGGVYVTRATPDDPRTVRDWSARMVQHAMRGDSIVAAATERVGCPPRHAYAKYDAAGHPVSMHAPQKCYSIVSPDYLRVLRYQILEGRDFSTGEFAEPVIIVSRNFARSMWPGRSAVGEQLKLDSAHTQGPWYRVVGVAGEPRSRALDQFLGITGLERLVDRPAGRLYGSIFVLNAADTARIAYREWFGRRFGTYINIVARGDGDPRRLPLTLRNRLDELGPNVRSFYPVTWGEMYGFNAVKAKHTFMASLFATFSLCALALAALGVYAIIAHMVAQRTREFGVRIAVGAGERDIRRMVIREGNILTLTGIAVGLLLTYKGAYYVRAFVADDYDRYDSRVFAVVALLLFATSWLASYLPARKAMRINPVEALRND